MSDDNPRPALTAEPRSTIAPATTSSPTASSPSTSSPSEEPVLSDHTATASLLAGVEGGAVSHVTSGQLQATGDKVRCDACPIRCFIKVGQTGSCDRYGNVDGVLTRMDPVTVLQRANDAGAAVVPFAAISDSWNGELVRKGEIFVTGTGSGTTYPDYKPAPFIVSQVVEGVDMVTVVTEGIFSYCGAKVKIDTDRHIGPERALVFSEGEEIGHVTTAEYGSQMLSLGGVHHLTGQGRKAGLATMRALVDLCSGEAIEVNVDGGSSLTLQAGQAPIIDGKSDERMRVGCGSAAIGMFASQWAPNVDEVVVVDDHITGVLTEHQAGVVLGIKPSGIKLKGRKSTPGRYFEIANPGGGWGGTDIDDPLDIIDHFKPKFASPGQTLLMVSTTGSDFAYYVLDDDLEPQPAPLPLELQESVERVRANCEPTMTSVLFMAGAGGSLRSGVTTNPIRLTESVRAEDTLVTCGGAPTFVWPGGGITFTVDVGRTPVNSFGHVPTPALVAPLEFTMRRDEYIALGGHAESIVTVDEALQNAATKVVAADQANPWPAGPTLSQQTSRGTASSNLASTTPTEAEPTTPEPTTPDPTTPDPTTPDPTTPPIGAPGPEGGSGPADR